MGRRRRAPSYSGPSPEQAAAEARAKAAADAAAMRAENDKQMAVMNAKLEAVSKASAYNPNMKIASTQGDMGKGLSRAATNQKKARAMKTSKTRIALDQGALGGAAGTGQVQV